MLLMYTHTHVHTHLSESVCYTPETCKWTIPQLKKIKRHSICGSSLW